MKKLFIAFLLVPFFANAQIVIPAAATIATAKDTQIGIQTGLDLINNSIFDFTNTQTSVTLNGGIQNLIGNFVFTGLSLASNGSKNINGNITVTNSLIFGSGYLVPAQSNTKVLFTGAESGITGANENSFFDCTKGASFYSTGDGSRLFPVGLITNPPLYAPATLEGITGETGVLIKTPAISFQIDTTEFLSFYQDRYWSILPSDASTVNGKVQLSTEGLSTNDAGGNTVWQAITTSDIIENIGSSSSNTTSVTSRDKVTAGFVGIGKEKSFSVKVHDLITPSGSPDVNDKLYIENISKFTHNKVTLLDRWGYVIHAWNDFGKKSGGDTDYDPDYDFSKLAPGNYIAVVEYGNDGEKRRVIQQMVTVLKIN